MTRPDPSFVPSFERPLHRTPAQSPGAPGEATLPRRALLAAAGAGLAAIAGAGCSTVAVVLPDIAKPAPMPRAPILPAIGPRDLALINRVSWGANTSAARTFLQMSRREWLQGQLHPSAAAAADARVGLPAAALAQIDAMTITAKPLADLVVEMEQQRRDADALTDDDAKKAAQQAYQQAMSRLSREATTRVLLRALYSPQQLQEQMSWFWSNHFSVHQYKSNLRVLVGDFEQQALRPRALGKFSDLLIAATTHPAMLRYLDNEQNAAGHLNENHARELMELHTLGVDGGYSQRDVQELARVLTGLGVRLTPTPELPRLRPDQQALYKRQGLTEFNPARHDMGTKTLLGQATQGRGWDEILDTLRRLARHPATGRFISRKLAQYFVGETPPPDLVAAMAKAFERTDGDIGLTLQTLFVASAYEDAAPSKFKDPMRFVVSAVRLAYDERVVLNTAPMLNWLNRLGEAPFNRPTPDGYPLAQADWSGSGQLAVRFEVARAIGGGSSGLFKPDSPEAAELPAFPLLANPLYYSAIEPTLGERTRAALAQASSPQEWNALLLSSPEFMMR